MLRLQPCGSHHYSLVVSSRRLVLGASALTVVVALASCGSKQAQPRRSAPTTPGSTTTTAATRATTTPTTGIPGGCPSGIGAAAQSSAQAARCLYEAWKKDDRASAAVFASVDVVDILFRQRWSPPEGTFKGCSAEPSTGGQRCTFDHHGASYVFGVQRSEGGLRVTDVRGPPGA